MATPRKGTATPEPIIAELPKIPGLPQEQLLAIIGQLALRGEDKASGKPTSNTKYVFEYLKIGAELWNVFSNLRPEPFTRDFCSRSTPFGGVYLIFRGQNLIYVGISDNLRRRITEHYGGKTNFAKELIGKYRTRDYRAFVEEHLTVSYKEIDDPTFQRAVEHVIIGVFNPLFNKE